MYVGDKRSTVSDYVFVNENILDRIKEFKIADGVDSNHMPLGTRIRKEEERKRGW